MIIVCLFLLISDVCSAMIPITPELDEPEPVDYSLIDFEKTSAKPCALLQVLANYVTGLIDCPATNCKRAFTTREAAYKHVQKNHNPITNFDTLMEQFYGAEKYLCLYCDAHYLTRKSFLTHTKTDHALQIVPSQAPEYPICIIEPITSAQWQLPVKLTKKKTSKATKSFECKKCDKSFTTNIQLLNHTKRNHGGAKTNICKYPGCNHSYSTPSSLKVHTLRHHSEKKFKCRYCESEFTMQGDLNQHYARKHF